MTDVLQQRSPCPRCQLTHERSAEAHVSHCLVHRERVAEVLQAEVLADTLEAQLDETRIILAKLVGAI